MEFVLGKYFGKEVRKEAVRKEDFILRGLCKNASIKREQNAR